MPSSPLVDTGMTSCWNGGDTGQGAGDVMLRKMHKIPACLAVEKETVKQENNIRGAVMGKVEGAVGS